MDLSSTVEEAAFREEVRGWLAEKLNGEFAHLRGVGGSGHEHEAVEARKQWERALGEAGWIGLALPRERGGRDATIIEQVIFAEEYARADGPGRVNHIGEQLLAPTLVEFAGDELCDRFLPGILCGEELWCQGYSEPGAGSDLAGVSTRAELVDGHWRINGQKLWTSLAHHADWCFVLARTESESERHKGLSYLLVPMHQDGIQVRPIRQLTGTSEFNEVFFKDAYTDADCVVGEPGDGWRVAMGTLGFERGVSTLAQQVGYQREFEHVLQAARANCAIDNPALRQRLVDAWVELRAIHHHAVRSLGSSGPLAASVSKLMWASWHRQLGELGVDVLGSEAALLPAPPYELSDAQTTLLFSRSDTIYGGSNEIQKNILAERVLGLPRG